MQVYLRPFDNILRQQNSIEWTVEHQKRFNETPKTYIPTNLKHKTRSKLIVLCNMRRNELAQHFYNRIKEQTKRV